MTLPLGTTARDLIQVLVADSNRTQSQLLSSALRRQPGMRVTSCSNRLSDCLEALQSASADVVALSDDPSNHDQLIEVLRGLHSSYAKLRLILVLDSYDRSLVVNAMRAGARGLFCRASQPFRALCRCITVVHQGQFWANTEQIGYVVDALTLNYSPRVVNAKGVGLLTPREEQVVVRSIEFMPLEEDRVWTPEIVVTLDEILSRMSEYLPLEEIAHERSETARRYRFSDGVGEIGIIAPVSHPFCGHCSRIRITSDGKLRTCLFSVWDHDLHELMRRGATDDKLAEFIVRVVEKKEERHHIGEPGFVPASRTMVHIGG